jgi:hypothetical protein
MAEEGAIVCILGWSLSPLLLQPKAITKKMEQAITNKFLLMI